LGPFYVDPPGDIQFAVTVKDERTNQGREGSRCQSVKPTRNRQPGRFLSFAAQAVATGLAVASRRSAVQCAGARRGSSIRGGHSAARTISPQTWRLPANHVPRLHRALRECFNERERSGHDRPRVRARAGQDHLFLHHPVGGYPSRDHWARARDPLVRRLPQVTRPARSPGIARAAYLHTEERRSSSPMGEAQLSEVARNDLHSNARTHAPADARQARRFQSPAGTPV
jgi:hypothetical protein